MYVNKSGDNQSDDSSSSNSEANMPEKHNNKQLSIQSDSDELSLGFVVARAISNRTSLRMKNSLQNFFRGRYSRLGNYHNV